MHWSRSRGRLLGEYLPRLVGLMRLSTRAVQEGGCLANICQDWWDRCGYPLNIKTPARCCRMKACFAGRGVRGGDFLPVADATALLQRTHLDALPVFYFDIVAFDGAWCLGVPKIASRQEALADQRLARIDWIDGWCACGLQESG